MHEGFSATGLNSHQETQGHSVLRSPTILENRIGSTEWGSIATSYSVHGVSSITWSEKGLHFLTRDEKGFPISRSRAISSLSCDVWKTIVTWINYSIGDVHSFLLLLHIDWPGIAAELFPDAKACRR
jgi:hypothetical protein